MIPASIDRIFPQALKTRLTELRRGIHEHPELAFRETETAARLTVALHDVGVADVRPIAETGLVARVPGRNRSGAVVAIRGDIDALPIQEATSLPYASRTAGVMHACGHDVHATWAVASAALLVENPAVLHGHRPAPEVDDPGTEGLVPTVQGCLFHIRWSARRGTRTPTVLPASTSS